MSKFIDNQIIMAAYESGGYGVDAAPGVNDALVVQDFKWSFADTRLAERNISTGSKLGAPKRYAGSLLELSFKVDIKGSGTIDAPPEFAPILRACGFLETINAATNVQYKADSDDEASCSIYFDDDGDEWRVVGCRGTAKLMVNAGDYGKIEFTVKGRLTQEPATSPGFTPVYDTTEPVPLLAVPLTVGGNTLEQSQFGIDLKNTMVAPPILNNANGYGEVRISKRATELGITLYPTNVAAGFDPVTAFTAGTTQTLAMPVVGTAAGNRWQLLMPGGAKITNIDPGDDEGLVSYEITADLLETAIGADDELTLQFT